MNDPAHNAVSLIGIAEARQEMPMSRMTVGALQDLGFEVDYNAADSYSLANLALCNNGGVKDFCPAHDNRFPLNRKLLRSKDQSHSRRRKLSGQGRETAAIEAARHLHQQRRVEETTPSDMIYLGGDIVTVYIEEAGNIFGETFTWDSVRDRIDIDAGFQD